MFPCALITVPTETARHASRRTLRLLSKPVAPICEQVEYKGCGVRCQVGLDSKWNITVIEPNAVRRKHEVEHRKILLIDEVLTSLNNRGQKTPDVIIIDN